MVIIRFHFREHWFDKHAGFWPFKDKSVNNEKKVPLCRHKRTVLSSNNAGLQIIYFCQVLHLKLDTSSRGSSGQHRIIGLSISYTINPNISSNAFEYKFSLRATFPLRFFPCLVMYNIAKEFWGYSGQASQIVPH